MTGASADPGGSARLFVALWPGAELRDALQAWSGQCPWNAEAKRVSPERLHLTLHFLGDVPRQRLPALRQALGQPFAPFTLSLGRPALWRGHLAVLEPEKPQPHLHRLHDTLAKVLQSLDLPTEAREFRPHLTIARCADAAILSVPGPRLRWPVRGYALVESRPRPGEGYVVLQTCP